MNKINLSFLMEMLNTPSPSSMEIELQKKWIEYVERFADEVRTDYAGNAIAVLNPDAKFKVLLAGHCDEIAFVVKRIDSNGFIYFERVGGVNIQAAVGMQMNILSSKGSISGVIGCNAEHHGGIKRDFSIEDLFIDCGFKTKEEAVEFVQVGDLIVYDRKPKLLQDRYITGRALDNRTGCFIIAEVLRRLSKEDVSVGVYMASTVNEETNMGGAYFAAAQVEPTLAIACDVTFATDYPTVDQNKHGEVFLEKGPVLAKGGPVHFKVNQLLEKSAKDLNLNIQYELTPRMSGTDADRMRLTNKGVPVALVSLPLRYMHSPVETASIQDIEDEIDLLVHFIKSLDGTENLSPFI